MTQYTRRRHHRVRRRFLAALASVGLVTGAVMLPGVNATQAAWTDSEHSASSSISAIKLRGPIASGSASICEHPRALTLGNALRFPWIWRSSGAPYPLPRNSMTWTASNGSRTITVNPTITSNGNGQYEATFTHGQLDPVAPNLVQEGDITIRASGAWTTAGGIVWTTTNDVVITMQIRFLSSGGTTCHAPVS